VQDVAQRLRDKKVAVRREALQQLAAVYRMNLVKNEVSTRGNDALPNQAFSWIPARLLRCCPDTDMRHHPVEAVIEEQLFPPRLSSQVHQVTLALLMEFWSCRTFALSCALAFELSGFIFCTFQDCVEWWILAFSEMDEREVSYLSFLLRKKHQFQQCLRTYLRARADLREAQSAKSRDAPTSVLAKLQSDCSTCCRDLAAHFPDPVQALDRLQMVRLPPQGVAFS
jgi:hypothetical protein